MEIQKLKSVGSVVDRKTKMGYPQYKNGKIDLSNGVHLLDCTDEWWSALNRLDNKLISAISLGIEIKLLLGRK